MHRKLAEFLDLHQGSCTVYEYTQEFNNLAQYGGHHVDTDEKKAELFVHTTRGTAASSSTVLGQPPAISTATVQPQPSNTTVVADGSQATTAGHTCWLPMLQLWENRSLRQ
jgi:hypothetical protein